MKIILITGTSKGIGKHLSEYYLNSGNFVCGCSRTEGTISHINYKHFKLNVSDESAVNEMIREIDREFSRIDVLINNAGIASMNALLLTPKKTVENIFETNFLGSFLFLRESSKIMIRNKGGRIVNFSTVAKPLNLAGESIYASSKAAIETLTKIAAKELADFNVTVNAIGPTPIETDLIKNVPKQKMQALLNQQSFHEFCTIEEIVNVINFFISSESKSITGQIIYLGGVF